ncbi:MAG: methyltransferase domain-containing protein [Candidatus Rokubacteria bacterium]|nr:methyltransferase domain-containing protein [Candidatus Rokubacteria bacterium]
MTTERRDALVQRLFETSVGTMELGAVYLGIRLGLYEALARLGPITPAQLAAATKTNERYAREWLEQQAVAGILEAGADTNGDTRRYTLPAGRDEVLLDPNSLSCFAPVVRFVIGALPMTSRLLDAFRTGDGIPWSAYGADVIEGQAGQNRGAFLSLLGQAWLPAIPEVHARLMADPPARVADIACGGGWSSIGIARAYPNVRVDGFDLDESSIALAAEHVKAAGLADRITMAVRDAGDPALGGRYDLVTIFESLHDMSKPVDVLAKARTLLAPGGAVLVMDERVAETFAAPGDAVERLMYGFSVLCCLPVGLADRPSAATGTVMRPATLRRYAEAAGFARADVLPIAHDIFRFYLLRP